MRTYTAEEPVSSDSSFSEPQRPADDVEEASMESFPASDPPATRHGTPATEESASSQAPDSASAALPDIDEKFWRKAILQRNFYRPEVGFDRYRWALRFGQMERRRHKREVEFASVVAELEAAWSQFGGPAGLSWEQARDAVRDSWEHGDTLQAEAIASHGGFNTPPTFCDHGKRVPRNIDEPNT